MTRKACPDDARPLIQVRRCEALGEFSPSELGRLCRRFRKRHWVRLPNFLEPYLLEMVSGRLVGARFRDYQPSSNHRRQVLVDSDLDRLLMLLLNDGNLFDFVRSIAEPSLPIRCFTGRIFRQPPGGNYHLSWHPDTTDGKLVSLTVNLSPAPYQGGLLEIKDVSRGAILAEIDNTGFGDAILFRASEDQVHRSTIVEGEHSKLTFSGWFRSVTLRDAAAAEYDDK